MIIYSNNISPACQNQLCLLHLCSFCLDIQIIYLNCCILPCVLCSLVFIYIYVLIGGPQPIHCVFAYAVQYIIDEYIAQYIANCVIHYSIVNMETNSII